jgi:hypothetical protein
MTSDWRSEQSVHNHIASAHFSTEASDIEQPTGYLLTLICFPLLSVPVILIS